MRRKILDLVTSAFPVFERLTNSKVVLIPRRLLHTLPEREQLRRFITYCQIDCIFDVGANMGQYAKMLRENVNYKGVIISFEPIPECAAYLKKISASDPLWHIEQVALSESVGQITFNVMKECQFSSLYLPDHSKVANFKELNQVIEQIPVDMTTIAACYDKLRLMYGFERPYLKMDTQGNDLKVARGAGEKLQCFYGLQSELAVVNIYNDTPDYKESISYYESQGFKLSALVPNNPGHFPRLVEIDCIMYNEALLADKIANQNPKLKPQL